LAAKTPDAPINLVNVAEVTTAYQVGLSWQDGAYDGASPIIDYQVSFCEASNNVYTVYASGVTSRSSKVAGLSPGTTYKFVVRSRNSIGFSVVSGSVTVLAA